MTILKQGFGCDRKSINLVSHPITNYNFLSICAFIHISNGIWQRILQKVANFERRFSKAPRTRVNNCETRRISLQLHLVVCPASGSSRSSSHDAGNAFHTVTHEFEFSFFDFYWLPYRSSLKQRTPNESGLIFPQKSIRGTNIRNPHKNSSIGNRQKRS